MPGDDGSGDNTLTVAIGNAALSVDGTAATPAVGDDAVILGEEDGDVFSAADVYAYSSPPSFLEGTVSAISGNVVTLTSGEDQSATTTSVDLTDVPVVVDGSSSTTSGIAVGDTLLVVETAVTSGQTPTALLAIDFNSNDQGPVLGNPGQDGNGDNGGNGDCSAGGSDS